MDFQREPEEWNKQEYAICYCVFRTSRPTAMPSSRHRNEGAAARVKPTRALHNIPHAKEQEQHWLIQPGPGHGVSLKRPCHVVSEDLMSWSNSLISNVPISDMCYYPPVIVIYHRRVNADNYRGKCHSTYNTIMELFPYCSGYKHNGIYNRIFRKISAMLSLSV